MVVVEEEVVGTLVVLEERVAEAVEDLQDKEAELEQQTQVVVEVVEVTMVQLSVRQVVRVLSSSHGSLQTSPLCQLQVQGIPLPLQVQTL
jgi:hypothetical protein